jgi:hypothetical protein
MISAASIEELDSACRTLTYNLVAKAVQTASPAGTTAPVAAPASQPAGTRESDEAAAARTRPKKERPVREPRPEPVPGEFDLLGFLSHGGGVLLRGAGCVLGVAAAEMRISSLDAWNEYINAEADAEDLYTDYSTIADMYDGTNIVSLSIAGGAALASSASWLLTDSISLSTFGRIGYALGSVMELGGSVLGLASLNQSAELHALYRDYLSAAEGAEDIYALYLTNREAYAANRSLACGLWAAGSAFLIASPLLPGEKTAAAPSLWNRALLALGSLLMSAGNITATAAMGARIEAEGRYEEYMAAEDPAEFYDSYLTAYKAYTASSWISYCLWAGGGIMTLVSLFVPMASPAFETAELPFSLSILPAPLGVGAEIRITLK